MAFLPFLCPVAAIICAAVCNIQVAIIFTVRVITLYIFKIKENFPICSTKIPDLGVPLMKVSIKTLGLVGKKYVDFSGGTPESKPLKPGAVLYGEESLKMEDLTRMGLDVVNKLKGVAQNIEKIVQNVERTVGDPALSKNIKGAVQNVNEITENVKVMTSSKEQVAETLRNLPELLKKVDASIANLKEITEKTDKLMGENRKNIDATMENVKEITNNLKEMTDDVKKHPWKLIRKP